ncbi:MAG: alpha/beta hydrolase [Candidatus Eisenbacteria bacterium]|uniref:Alpha/beta hydrolase n=1 Tax=Eiseniibacteriota bacterium TaxID=2212470 RepID=A0A956NJF8_UNCEI|nr:alpha/beta hydrolase [Candidatus Eisenbacteria bacterium]
MQQLRTPSILLGLSRRNGPSVSPWWVGWIRILFVVISGIFAVDAGAVVFPIGTTARTFVDSSRSNRDIACDVYYPGATSGQDVPTAEGAFPVVSFGHGFLIGTARYGYLGEGLASAGFIVVIPRSEGGVFPDHGAFGLDLAFVLRALAEEAEQPGSLWEDHVQPESAVLGHSMGGGASFLAADSDPGITAIANLAAAETNPSAIAAASRLSIPALLLAGENDCVTPPGEHQIPMYEALGSSCRTLVTVRGGSHCQFAESGSVCELGELGCNGPGISRAEQHAVVLDLLIPWLNSQLRGDLAAWNAFQQRIAQGNVFYEQDCAVTDVLEADSSDTETSQSVPPLVITPNPTTGYVSFQLPTSAGDPLDFPLPATLRVLDAAGRVLDTSTWESPDVALRWDRGTEVPSGVYWVTVESDSRLLARGRIQILR